MYMHCLRATCELRAIFRRDYSWITLCKGQVLPSYAKSSVNKCTDVLLITTVSELTETATLTSENLFAYCFVFKTTSSSYVDLFAAKSGYGGVMMQHLTDFSGATPIYMNAIQSAKWFYFDAGGCAFRTTQRHYRPRVRDGCAEMYFVKADSDEELYQHYQRDRLITEHLYLYMRIIDTTGEARIIYKRMFFDVCQKIAKHFEKSSVPNYIRKNMKKVMKLS